MKFKDNRYNMVLFKVDINFLVFNQFFELLLVSKDKLWELPQAEKIEGEIGDGNLIEALVPGISSKVPFKIIKISDDCTLAIHWDSALEIKNQNSETLEFLFLNKNLVSPELQKLFPTIRKIAYKIPYIFQKKNQYIYPFRTKRDRNSGVYQIDHQSDKLYQSDLCKTIKLLKRTKERTSGDSAWVDFGKVRYVIPSHFGFCLGVQNAIERAYEALTLNPDKRVFMLSDLIHNPFVNEDLNRRGLRYLQTDKRVPVMDEKTGLKNWDTITKDDVVIIPAFGATDEDKSRLIEKGIPFTQFDATCMLVEKVWKAAKKYGQKGYSIIIHGKSEHEETRTTFSNATKSAPSVIIRNLVEAQQLIEVIRAKDPDEKSKLFAPFIEKSSEDFDPNKHLDRIAVVNQTTLLRNETLEIISNLEKTFASLYGKENVIEHISKQQDTLCYATQVNQDALTHALGRGIDFAIIVGGKKSSNTYQLFRICEEKLGDRVAYIQSEDNILSSDEILHYLFISDPKNKNQGKLIKRPFLNKSEKPFNILISGGASCPDGLIQQVINKINGFYPTPLLRPIEDVLRDVENDEDLAQLL